MELSNLCHGKLKNVEEQLTQILTADGHKETFSISRGGVNVQDSQFDDFSQRNIKNCSRTNYEIALMDYKPRPS